MCSAMKKIKIAVIESVILDLTFFSLLVRKRGHVGPPTEAGPFKGTVSPDYICLEVVWFNRPRLKHVLLGF